MFFISFPKDFKIGDTRDCRINGDPQKVTWKDADTLVIEPSDVRKILSIATSRDLLNFTCGDPGDTAYDLEEVRDDETGELAGIIVGTK